MLNNKMHSKKELERWTREEVRLLKSLYSSTSIKEIARQTGRSYSAVVKKAANLWLKKNKWPDRKLKEFSRLFPTETNVELSRRFKCSEGLIKTMADRLGLIKTRGWSKEDEQKLKKLYPDTPIQELVRNFKRSGKQITDKAYKLGLNKSTARGKEWSQEDIKLLKKQYPNMENKILAEHFSCSLGAIGGKADDYGLKKSRKFMAQKK
jgi:hypothetical protein